MRHNIKDMQMHALPQAQHFLLHEGRQTTPNILPIVFCHPGHEAHHCTDEFNLFSPLTFGGSVFRPHLSLKNRDPLKDSVFMLLIQSTWWMSLPCSSNRVRRIINSIQSDVLTCLPCTLRHYLPSVFKW